MAGQGPPGDARGRDRRRHRAALDGSARWTPTPTVERMGLTVRVSARRPPPGRAPASSRALIVRSSASTSGELGLGRLDVRGASSTSSLTCSPARRTFSTNHAAIDAVTTPSRAIPATISVAATSRPSTVTGIAVAVADRGDRRDRPPDRLAERGDRRVGRRPLGLQDGQRGDEPDQRDGRPDVDRHAAPEVVAQLAVPARRSP